MAGSARPPATAAARNARLLRTDPLRRRARAGPAASRRGIARREGAAWRKPAPAVVGGRLARCAARRLAGRGRRLEPFGARELVGRPGTARARRSARHVETSVDDWADPTFARRWDAGHLRG